MNDNEKNIDTVETDAVEETVSAEPAAAEGKAAGFMDKVKKIGKKNLIIGAVAILVVVIVAVAALAGAGGGSGSVGGSTSGPLGLVTTGLSNSIEALQENETMALLNSVLTGGSTEVSADLETITESVVGYPMLEGTASVKVHTDLGDKAAAVVAGVKLDKSEELDASIYVSEDSIAVASKWLLGKEAYGVDLKKLVENFAKSEFGEDGEYSLGFEMPEDAKNIMADVKVVTEDTQALAEDAVAELLKSIKKNAEIEKESATLTFAGEEVKTTAVSVSVDPEQLAAIAADMVDYVRTDKGVKKYLEDNIKYILIATEEYDEDMDKDDMQEYIDEFYEGLEDIDEDSFEDLVETLEDSDFSLDMTFHVTKSGKQLVGVEVKAEADDEQIKASVYAGPDFAELTEISARVSVDEESYRISYTVDTNDKAEYKAELKVREGSETLFSGEVEWDKKEGDFVIKATDGYDEFAVKGTLEKSGKKATIVLKSVSADDEKIDLDVTVTLNASDKVPSTPKFNDVLKMDADEIEELVEELGEIVEDLVYDLY